MNNRHAANDSDRHHETRKYVATSSPIAMNLNGLGTALAYCSDQPIPKPIDIRS